MGLMGCIRSFVLLLRASDDLANGRWIFGMDE